MSDGAKIQAFLSEREEKFKRYFDNMDRIAEKNLARTDPPHIIPNKQFIQHYFPVKEVPVVIGSSEHVGSVRARIKNYEAYLDYFQEEQALKQAGAPIFPVFIR